MLFVIAMEGLSTLVEYAEVEGKVKGLGKNEAKVNHNLFADDVMLLSKATRHCIEKVEEVLGDFAKASGLKPNMKRSRILFCKGVKAEIRSKSNFKEGVLPIKYLGVPLHCRRLNICHYQSVVDKIKKKSGS